MVGGNQGKATLFTCYSSLTVRNWRSFDEKLIYSIFSSICWVIMTSSVWADREIFQIVYKRRKQSVIEHECFACVYCVKCLTYQMPQMPCRPQMPHKLPNKAKFWWSFMGMNSLNTSIFRQKCVKIEAIIIPLNRNHNLKLMLRYLANIWNRLVCYNSRSESTLWLYHIR